jgi:hypothetical protein
MSRNSKKSKTLRLGALMALAVLSLSLAAPVAQAQVKFVDADFSGYASGTYVHADALTLGTPVVNLDLAVSSAATASKGLTAVTSGLGQVVSPALPDKKSYGRGSGLDLAALSAQLLNQRAEAAAPPSTELLSRPLVGPLDVPGVLSVTALEGQAQARWDDSTCILGQDLNFGLGRAANARVLGGVLPSLTGLLGTAPSNVPDGGAVRTSSRTRLVPQTGRDGAQIGPNLGLMAETRQTLAPVVLFQGIPGAELTIELLGEWTLRAVATGIANGAYVQYQPATAGATPVLKISNTLPVVGEVVDSVLVTLNQLLGQTPLPGLLNGDVLGLGLVDLALNPAPTVTESADGTNAKASVDVVRVRLLPGATGVLGQLTNSLIPNLELADVRIGHMEVEAKVPAGGVICPGLDVTKSTVDNVEVVNAGTEFGYNVNLRNPYDCELTANRLGDQMTVTNAVKFTIKGADPAGAQIAANTVTYADVGTIAPRGTRDVRIQVAVDPESPSGQFTNTAKAISNCSLDSAQGAKVNVELTDEDTIVKPRVEAQKKPPLPRTGGNSVFYATAATLLAAVSAASAIGYRKLRNSSEPGSGQ